jgi:hypothetical protein
VFLIGGVVGGRAAFGTVDAHDTFDGDMTSRVLRLMQLTDGTLAGGALSAGAIHLENAYLWMLDQLRKIYISDQVQRTSHVRVS